MTKRDKVKMHKVHEKKAADLAKKYAAQKEYAEAARWYYAAAFHRRVSEELKVLQR